jgi:site-specific recombinase XerD
MIGNILWQSKKIALIEAGPLGKELTSFATALDQQRYAKKTIRSYLRELHLFFQWLDNADVQPKDITDYVIERYVNHLAVKYSDRKRKRDAGVTAIRAFMRYLESTGELCHSAKCDNWTQAKEWLRRYGDYLERVQGLMPGTRRQYLLIADRFLKAQTTNETVDWSAVTADTIIDFAKKDMAQRKGFGPHRTATALRSFLRFLVSQGAVKPGLEAVIPTVRTWTHAGLPQHFRQSEIERVLAVCSGATGIERRNYAIIRLLSRLGLRANEVNTLRLDDVDWKNGYLLVRASKSRSERKLPLPQDVGEALLKYLQEGRPETSCREIFLRHTAPYVPLNCHAISGIVKCLLKKADIDSTRRGAHLFRHTAATELVNHGAAFKDVADFLGHRWLQTTAIYAKLDLEALSSIALPWRGGEQ